jgi:hypothetical protein
MNSEPSEMERERLDTWHPPLEPLKALEKSKPAPRETPLPDLLIYTEKPDERGTPTIVAERLRELKEKREQIAQMWNAEGRTRTYIPNTAEARKMKLQAKLQNRAEAKHAEIVKKRITLETKPIHLPPDTVVIQAVEL